MPLHYLKLLFMCSSAFCFIGCANSLQDCDKLVGVSNYILCLAENGSKQAQYEVGLAAYEVGETDEAIKWFEKAAKPIERRTPVFIPTGGGEVRIQMEEMGLSEPGHEGAKRLLEKINNDVQKM